MPDSIQFIPRNGRLPLTRAIQYSFGARHVRPLGAFPKEIFGSQRGQFLRHGDVDELIQCDAFRLCYAARFDEKGLLQTQCYVTFSHFDV